MPVFLVPGWLAAGLPSAALRKKYVSDVLSTDLFANWIEELARRGVTNGCATNPLRYCPDSTVTNAEMAIFLLRSKDGGSYVPPACPASPFNDVPCTHWAAAWIAEAKKRGIAVGDALGKLYPDQPLTRAQMAGFLTRTFDFPVRIDPRTPRTVDLAYTNGLLTNVTGYGTLSYHPNLLIHQVTHGNGVVETWSNDPNSMRRPRSISAAGPAGLDGSWSSGDCVYDGTGNITKIGNAWFTYDKVNRLTAGNLYTAPLGGGTATQQGYTYDPFGNLTAITGDRARNTPTTAATNRLTSGTYDAAGNLTNWNGAVYQYDRFNQMVRMTSGGEDWAYVYTADDERIWSYNLAANVSTWTLRDLSGQVLREYANESGTWTVGTDYIRRDGQLLAAETRLGRRHFHLDHLGTPRLITNSVGYQKAYHVYYPFGEEATAFDQDGERMKFTGHERDLASGEGAGDDLDYMHARHYSPVTGRFLSTDPLSGSTRLRMPQTWNRFSYVLNNPLAFIDPSGQLWFRVNGKWEYKKGVNQIEKESTDKSGNLVVTVVAGRSNFLTFDGGTLVLYKEDGSVRGFAAVSGELDGNGRTQPHLVGERNRGPLPEGRYYFNPALIQSFADIGLAQQAAGLFRRGEWPGAKVAWGDYRVQLTPDSSTETYGRGGFFIHGGYVAGSAGCIDLCGQDREFFSAVPHTGAEILLEVDYP